MWGNQWGALNRSSICSRVSDRVLPGAVFGLPSSFDGGSTLSVTGKAQSGRSAPAATAGGRQEARPTTSRQTKFLIRAPLRVFLRNVPRGRLPRYWAAVLRMTTALPAGRGPGPRRGRDLLFRRLDVAEGQKQGHVVDDLQDPAHDQRHSR